MLKLQSLFGTVCVLIPLIAIGCGKKENAPAAIVASPPPTPAPKVGVVAEKQRFAFSDKDGKRVAEISADSGAATGTNVDNIVGEMKNAQATLYQKGKPVATLTADKVIPDTQKRTITASGNAKVQSVDAADGIPSVLKANTLVWAYDQNNITGRGNVEYTKRGVITIPATFFTGDASFRQYKLLNETSSPVVGKF